MNWTRTILDGLAMAAYSLTYLPLRWRCISPGLCFPSYPPAIIKAANRPPTREENRFYWLWICFGELLPLLLYGCGQRCGGRDNRILASIPDGIHPVDDDQHRRSSFSGCVADPEKSERPFCDPWYRGTSRYEFTDWMKGYALPEHLLQWPLLLCPAHGGGSGGIGAVIAKDRIGDGSNETTSKATKNNPTRHPRRGLRKLDV